MRSKRGIFWYSLGLTLLLLLPMILTVAFFADQYQKQQLLRRASAADSTLRIEPGAQGIFPLLLVIQQEEPAFLLVRADGPQQTLTLCALPGSLRVNAPAGTTTLADCTLAAGAGRAAQLLCGTVATGESAAPALHYIAATPATWAACAGSDALVRFDTAALLTPAARQALGYGREPVAECTAAQAGTLIEKMRMERYVESFILTAGSVDIDSPDLTIRDRLTYAGEQTADTFKKVFPYVLAGVAIGAVIHNWIPEAWIVTVLGNKNPLGVVLATLIGVPMYADIFGTIPIAEALFAKGAQLGSVLSFMMAVTTLSLPSMIMLRKAVKPKLLALFVAICTVGIILVGYLFNLLQTMLV